MNFIDFLYYSGQYGKIDFQPYDLQISNCDILNTSIQTFTSFSKDGYEYVIINENFKIHLIKNIDDTNATNYVINTYIPISLNNITSDVFLQTKEQYLYLYEIHNNYEMALQILKRYIDINDPNKFDIIVRYTYYLIDNFDLIMRSQHLIEDGDLYYKKKLFPAWLKSELGLETNTFISKLKVEDGNQNTY